MSVKHAFRNPIKMGFQTDTFEAALWLADERCLARITLKPLLNMKIQSSSKSVVRLGTIWNSFEGRKVQIILTQN